jgi:hypothetical protein
LFADTGLFVWANSVARRGAFSPARKVFVIGKTLAHAGSLGSDVHVRRNEALVDLAVEAGYARFVHGHLVPLADLRLASEPQWDPHVAMAEIMVADCGADAIRSAKSRLDSSGVRLGYEELHDLSTVFVNSHLRGAVRSFDPVQGEGKEAAWLSTVFFRFALRHGLIARGLESNLDLAAEVRDSSPEPDIQLELAAEQRSLELLPGALARLPSLQRDALRLYFGLEGREHAIKEVAAALRTNSYYARLAITSGLMGLASEMGAVGLLSQGDLGLAKALFVEGRDASSVAVDLGVTRSELLKRTSTIAKQVSASLRHHTVVPKNQASAGGKVMSVAAVDLPLLFREFQAKRLDFSRDDEGHVLVVGQELSAPLPVEQLREELIKHSEEMSRFESELEEVVARVFAPEASERRDDLPPDQQQWIEMLGRAELASREDVRSLVSMWTQAAERKGVAIDDGQLVHAEERIRDSLATVSTALVESMPRKLRRTGSAVLWVTFGPSPAESRFSWDGSEGRESFPTLHSLVRQRLGMVGDFRGEPLDLLATCVIQALHAGHSYLPDFDRTSSKSKAHGDTRLVWTRAAIKTETLTKPQFEKVSRYR